MYSKVIGCYIICAEVGTLCRTARSALQLKTSRKC